jgi:mannose-6-phosphate isomerase-like protein (cupin superfamily)
MKRKTHIRATEPFRWEDVPLLAYKEDNGTHFRDITRQILFGGSDQLGAELRYFEIGPGGHSTLERHEHVHSVMIVRGGGQVLVGNEVHAVTPNSLIYVPPHTWHQFRATGGEALGFICLVRYERDKPERPAPRDLVQLRSVPEVASFIRV